MNGRGNGWLLWRLVLALVLLWPGKPARAQTAPDLPAPRTIAPNTNDEVAYIDAESYLRTYDYDQPDIQWLSPSYGWENLALGDFNGDGDMEIVAIGGSENGNRLAIYDPVVASGAVNPDNNYGGDVYWELLFDTTLPDTPRLVTAGAFLPTTSGGATPVGFAVVYDDPDAPDAPENDTRIRIYVPANDPPDGRQWRILTDQRRNTSRIAAGNLDGVGGDDLVVVDRVRRTDSELLALSIQTNGAFVRLFDDETIGVEAWVDATVGPVDPSYTGNDVAAIRESSLSTPLALYVLRYFGGGNAGSIYARSFLPPPFTIFLGDITRDGVDEMFMLRTLTCNPSQAISAANPPQLFMRRAVAGSTLTFEVCLDRDNAFKSGAAGDLDGDGAAEVVMLSRYQMRIFTQPESSTATFSNVAVNSNPAVIAVGNLDTNGNATTPRLAATTSSIEVTLQAGTRIGPINIQVYNGGTTEAVDFAVFTVPGSPFVAWQLSANQTNANLAVWLDGTALLPGGVYGANLAIVAQSDGVANSPLVIPVIVNVIGVGTYPTNVAAMTYPCDTAPRPLAPITRTLTVSASPITSTMTFSVSIEPLAQARIAASEPITWPSSVPWVAATSPTVTLPSTLQIVIDPNLAAPQDEAQIVLWSLLDGALQYRHVGGIYYICTDHALFLPAVANE